jgi:hypothetical protein
MMARHNKESPSMRIRRSPTVRSVLSLGLALLCLAGGSLRAAPARDLVLAGGTLIDVSSLGRSTSDIKDSVIVIRGGQIVAAGPRNEVGIPAGSQVIDVSGKYIVPGLSDAFSTLNNQAQANAYLYMGVTSIIGLGEPPDGRRGPLFLDAHPSPRIYPLDWEWSPDASVAPGALVEQIDALARSGIKVLLLHYGMTPGQVRVAANHARKLGMATIGELGATTYAQGTHAGLNAVVHTSRYSLDVAPPELRKEVAADPFGPPRIKYYQYLVGLSPSDPALQRNAKVLAARRVGLIPTASLLYLELPGHANPWKEPIAAILDPKDIHLPANPVTGERENPDPTKDPADGFPSGVAEAMLRIDEQYVKAGARFLAGSGADAFGTLPGISLHTELELLTRIGLTPRQALAAATSNFGTLMGWDQVGQVKAGYNADLLVLDEDPVQDVSNLKKISRIILNGEILDRDALLHPPAAAQESGNKPAPSLAQQIEKPPLELTEVSWMTGNWDITARIFATATTPERVSQGVGEVLPALGGRWLRVTDRYPDGGVDEGYLTYNGSTKKWTNVTLDAGGNAFISTSEGWQGNRIVFVTPEIEIVGEKATLRQTIERRSDTEYHLLNEERLPDGRWVALDEYTYRKRSEGAVE